MGRNRITAKRRKDQAWTLTRPTEDSNWCARFSVAGHTTERSTGTRDEDKANAEAAKLVATARAGELRVAKRAVRQGAGAPLEDLIAGWLEWLTTTHAQRTREVWEGYTGSHWLKFFGSIEKVTEAGCAEYRRQRLGKVLAETVRHELTALRNFVAFCSLPEIGAISESFKIEGVPRRITGKAHPVRRRTAADPNSPDEIRQIIELLPEWGGRKGPPGHPWHPPLFFRKRKYRVRQFPIRARFEFAYLTGLRPGTLDKLEVPLHWEPGRATLQLTDEADKIRWGRELPLEPRALEILAEVAPKKGLVFGHHDYREHLKAAAARVLPPERAKRFAGSHLRSMFTTHALELGKNIMGIQYRVGHKLMSTTARYAKPSFRAALETVGVTPDLKAPPQVSGDASERTGSKIA